MHTGPRQILRIVAIGLGGLAALAAAFELKDAVMRPASLRKKTFFVMT